MLFTVICVVVVIILWFIYLRGKNSQKYWTKRGVLFYDKNKSFGPLLEFVIGKRSVFELLFDIYKYGENVPVVGMGNLFQRSLYIKDLVNMEHVNQVDFQSFYHRGVTFSDSDVLANNVLFLNGPKWKLIRNKLTPLFTGAKLKNMYYIIDKSAQDFVEFLKQNPDRLKGDAHQVHETITRFCTAAISGAVFGIETTESTFDSPFRHMVKKTLTPSLSFNLKFLIAGISDSFFRALGIKFFGDHENFFVQAIKQVIRQRKQDGVIRHDFVDMCVKLQKSGTMLDPDTGLAVEPTDEVMAAQAFFFFIAGIDPTAAAMFGTIMELGRHPHILKQVHEEVDTVFEKHNNQLSYDAIAESEYLDRVLSESMRLYPPLAYLTRQCTKDSVLPTGNVPVEKGLKIFMPIYELHHDPKYFPNPEVFDPDRFAREGEVNEMAYIPFGRGYRACIGGRYARLQLMSGLMHFLRHYTVKTSVRNGGLQFLKEPTQCRLKNVDLEFVPRNQ